MRSSFVAFAVDVAGADKEEMQQPEAKTWDPFDLSDMAPGDLCETITVLMLEPLGPPEGAGGGREELGVGSVLEVLRSETDVPPSSATAVPPSPGNSHDHWLKVQLWSEDASTRASNHSGWIRSRSSSGTPQVVHRRADISFALWDFAKGKDYSTTGPMRVREGESLSSEERGELPQCCRVTIEEISTRNARRARISSNKHCGWVSTVTRAGQPLLEPLKPQRADIGEFGPCSEQVLRLLEVAQSGDKDGIETALTDHGPGCFSSRPNPNAIDSRGRTALMLAAASGHSQAVEALLGHTETGLDVNWVDGTLKTALHHAAMRSPHGDEVFSGDLVEKLIQAGLCVEAVDVKGRTALQLAVIVSAGCAEVVNTLLDKRANVNAEHLGSLRPVEYANLGGHQELVDLLSQKGGRWSPKGSSKDENKNENKSMPGDENSNEDKSMSGDGFIDANDEPELPSQMDTGQDSPEPMVGGKDELSQVDAEPSSPVVQNGAEDRVSELWTNEPPNPQDAGVEPPNPQDPGAVPVAPAIVQQSTPTSQHEAAPTSAAKGASASPHLGGSKPKAKAKSKQRASPRSGGKAAESPSRRAEKQAPGDEAAADGVDAKEKVTKAKQGGKDKKAARGKRRDQDT